MPWLTTVLLVISAWFTLVLACIGLILVGQWLGARYRFRRDVRAMWAELATVTLDPAKGRLP